MNAQSELTSRSSTGDARVAFKLSSSKVVINQGADQGVSLGQVFLIYALGEMIIDPIRKSELGHLEVVRGRGRVVHLQENLATLDSIEVIKERVRTITRTSGLTSFFGPDETEKLSDAPFDGVEVGDYCRPV